MRTYSKGLATDYELMIRKGNKGMIRTIIAGEKPLLFETKREDGYSFTESMLKKLRDRIWLPKLPLIWGQ